MGGKKERWLVFRHLVSFPHKAREQPPEEPSCASWLLQTAARWIY